MRFAKMHGIGNDFVMVDARTVDADWSSLAAEMCDRHMGIGADGLILVLPSDRADAKMRMFNPDGSESEMCGNGIRTFAKFVVDDNLMPVNGDSLTVETLAGDLELRVHTNGSGVESVTVDMGKPRLVPADIPVDATLATGDKVIAYPLEVDEKTIPVTCVSMGNPHAVTFIDDVASYPLDVIGPKVENHPFFPRRVNFEIARVVDRTHIKLRVWERGAGLTLACGTGACATVVAARLHGLVDPEVEVMLPGGPLVIRWEGEGHPVQMRGPAAFVYAGDWPGK